MATLPALCLRNPEVPVKSEELKQIVIKAQGNINGENNSFIQKSDAVTDDPDTFVIKSQQGS